MRQCEMCGKGSVMGGKRKLLRAHYNPVSWKRKYPNLQWGRVGDTRKKMCIACLRQTHKHGASK